MAGRARPGTRLYKRPDNPRKTKFLVRIEAYPARRSFVGTPPRPTSAKDNPATDPVPDEEGPWGISLSGGGIRSATFCLGVLQEMRRHGKASGLAMLEGNGRASYVTSVSGGSYIGGAVAVLNKGPFDVENVNHSGDRELGWLYGWAVPSHRDSCPTNCAPHSFCFPEGYFVAAALTAGTTPPSALQTSSPPEPVR